MCHGMWRTTHKRINSITPNKLVRGIGPPPQTHAKTRITMTNTIEHPLFDQQVELEQEMRHAGIKRFRENVAKATEKGQGSNTMTGTRLVVKAHERMVEAIKGFMDEANSGKAGRRSTAVKYLNKLDMDVTANITARACLDLIVTSPTLTKLAFTIGSMLENEVNATIFEEQMPKAYAKFHKRALEESLARRQWSHLLVPAELLGVQLETWPEKDRLLIGMKLVELFAQATGLIEPKMIFNEKNGKVWMVQATPSTLDWMEEENSRLETLFPIYMPTIVPPKPWTTPFDGAYYTMQIRSLTLVKTSNRHYLKELQERDMSEVYDAVNALQDTPWAINTRILDVMQEVYNASSELGDLPSAENLPLPQKPHWLPKEGRMDREEMSPEQLDEFKAWKADAHRVYYTNGKSRAKRSNYLRTIAVAQKFRDAEAIFFPHQLDWRGRAYPIPLYLQPQGSDVQRGLLQFADGLPISDQIDADWLAIHGAGCFGFDKVSLEDRVQWVADHEEQIIASAMNPFDHRFWLDADKPWQFLAFCYEWAEFKQEGFGFVSYLPVQMDGTCNGLQNFSAMLLDEVGGAAVNLIPADKPQDIYQKVADIVALRVEQDLFNEDDMIALIARGWSGKVNRKVCKRPVMTLAYGAKRFGFVGQVEEDTLKPWRTNDPESYPFIMSGDDGKPFDFGYKAAMYMAGLIWEAVGEVVIAARAAMDWLQAAAQIVSKKKLPINWSTPTGFLVQQAYRVPDMKLIETAFNQTRIRISQSVGLGQIDSRRQASGISPNWVHSLDASHLMKTICRAKEEGITAFSMIHDSYGTHAANAGALAKFLREEFVQMYAQVDVLVRFKEELESMSEVELPDLPPKGTLDLEGVLESSFFFA